MMDNDRKPDAMVEAVARDMAKAAGLDWDGKAKATEYANHGYWLPLATAAIAAMQAHMVPAGWRYDHPRDGFYLDTQRRHLHDGWTETPLYAEPPRAQPDAEVVARVAMALCESALGGKRCPCVEKGEFSCADNHPGRQAKAALAALEGTRYV